MFLTLIITSLLVGSSLCDKVITLDEDNWKQIMKGEWMIEFYAPWCPACKMLTETWAEFSDWTEDLNLDGVAKVDVSQNPGLTGRFMVTALPTIYHVKDGEFRQYRNPRTKDDFISYIEEKKWNEVETIMSLRHPDTFQMTLFSYVYKATLLVRDAHRLITETYGYPNWVSYVTFGIVTIALGCLLGLVLVLCIDLIYGPATYKAKEKIMVSQKQKDEELKTNVKELEEKAEEEEEDDDEVEIIERDSEEKIIEEEKSSPSVRKRRAQLT